MLRTRIGALARAAGYEKAHHFELDSGFSSGMAWRLYHDDVKAMELATMEKLCLFFGCEVADLFETDTTATPKQRKSKQKKALKGKN